MVVVVPAGGGAGAHDGAHCCANGARANSPRYRYLTRSSSAQRTPLGAKYHNVLLAPRSLRRVSGDAAAWGRPTLGSRAAHRCIGCEPASDSDRVRSEHNARAVAVLTQDQPRTGRPRHVAQLINSKLAPDDRLALGLGTTAACGSARSSRYTHITSTHCVPRSASTVARATRPRRACRTARSSGCSNTSSPDCPSAATTGWTSSSYGQVSPRHGTLMALGSIHEPEDWFRDHLEHRDHLGRCRAPSSLRKGL